MLARIPNLCPEIDLNRHQPASLRAPSPGHLSEGDNYKVGKALPASSRSPISLTTPQVCRLGPEGMSAGLQWGRVPCQTLGGWEHLETAGTWRAEGAVKLRGQK